MLDDELEQLFTDSNPSVGTVNMLKDFPVIPQSYTPTAIRERYTYGIAMCDLQQSLQHIYYLYAAYFRQLGTMEANILLESLIDVNEYVEENTVTGFDNLIQLKALSTLHLQIYGEKYVEAVKLWPKLYTQVVETTEKLDEFTIVQLIDTLIVGNTTKWVWEDVKSLLPDPTVVTPQEYPTHIEERGERGYSRYDTKVFASYIHWVVMQTVLFMGSDKSLGIPLRYSEHPYYWDDILRAFLEGMIYGSYNENLSAEQKTIYETSVLNMLDIFPDFMQ